MIRFIYFLGLLFAALLSFSAQADEVAYLDDRTNVKSILASYISAINRHEFARAWSYGDHEGTGEVYGRFVAEYAPVQSIEYRVGNMEVEGAAGSIFTKIPVVMTKHMQSGPDLVYAGCLVTRMVNSEIQEPPFKPLHFWESQLTLVKESFENAEYGDCEF